MTGQEEQTRDFFNRIAGQYSDKYSARDKFAAYFFNERLEKATHSLDISGKNVLDIGAGTGNLYEHLAKNYKDLNYYAVDIAAEMLAASNVPEERRYIGKCYEVGLPVDRFQFIFMLGVSTYLDAAELDKTMQFIATHLDTDGLAIISFTNKSSLDTKIRLMTRFTGRLFKLRKRVLGQQFKIYPKSLGWVEKHLPKNLRIQKVSWLNHTIFPFSRLFPTWSIKKAERIDKKWRKKKLRTFSSDFLIFCKNEKENYDETIH